MPTQLHVGIIHWTDKKKIECPNIEESNCRK